MKNVTLHQLQVFEVTARRKSFTRAAEELFLAQPTVSMQIKQLTKAVGLPLFEQMGKRLYLTDAGRELLTTCQEVFDRLSQFEMTVSDMQGLKKGKLKLAAVSTAKYFAPRLLGPFCQRYPDIDVSLKVTNRERVLERLCENNDDLYILGNPPEEDIIDYPFMEDILVVIAPNDHPLAGEKNIPLQRLAEEPFLMRESGSGTRMMVQRFFDAHNFTPHVRMELGSSEAIKQAVLGGLGLSVLSHQTLTLERAAGLLVTLDVEGFPIERFWHVVHPSGKRLSVVARSFLTYLLDEGKQVLRESEPKFTLNELRTNGNTL
ncbi:LysR family transcriptional regulator [Anthocerotibacter panamensis]|uniref:LysR family transcriptional regulator n=1 Tax=Anthocerotibacter panamensis TaxID=2857077 RepID=UPI001C40861F|nr:LysR family transcriptional regulator [Anthocerotibacter panamensis]